MIAMDESRTALATHTKRAHGTSRDTTPATRSQLGHNHLPENGFPLAD